MSVSEFEEARPEPAREGFERTPPQDIAAEQSVLGGMMLSKDAIADVVENLKPVDFYRPAHELVYNAILDLYARGEPADAVTVAAELTKRTEIGRVGGAPYLHTLISSVPTAANAEYYARIVREQAVLRRLVEAGTRIVQMGYAADGEVDDIVNNAQAEVYKVTEQRTTEDYAPLADIMEGALDEIEAIGSRGGQMSGIPTGFTDLDSLTNGLHAGQMIVIAARPAMGKALALDTPLPTPTGWTTMGEVRVGDLLIGADGAPTRVVAATEVLNDRPCYEVEFSDGAVIVADGAHQWVTETRAERRAVRDHAPEASRGAVRTTEEIAATVRCATADRRLNHAVRVAAPACLPERDLPLPPYVLGAWLGDGHSAGSRFTTADPEMIDNIEREGIRAVPTSSPMSFNLCLPDPGAVDAILSTLGVLDDKHIPEDYLRASEAQRRALLAGLLDTDGHVSPSGTVRFAVTNRRLAEGTLELVLSLGYRATMRTEPVKGRDADTSIRYQVNFTPADKVFRLTRKIARQSTLAYPTTRLRYIAAVRRIDSVSVRCVEVDNADHLYLAGRAWIPTHNSTLGLDIARACSIRNGLSSVIFSLEMGRNEIMMRLLSAEARVALHHMRSGSMTDDDWTRLSRKMGEVTAAPMYIDDSPNLSMMEIRAKCRRLKQKHDLRLVIIDYLQLMQSGGSRRAENRQQEVSEMSRNLKLLAKELEVPVVAMSQLNRGPEQRTDKKPMVSDLRESGSIEQDADMVILLHREDAYEKESPRAGEADLIVAKHRNGPTATITVAFQGHYSRFVDMAQS
ncbi:replicative DNA helicase [Embleya sp. MST-111070]|uniref:replicative DNA helicase n=1 Tax=Embleya sp. MST-111070 TaxID=3398231 RepID=UPI003F73AEB6